MQLFKTLNEEVTSWHLYKKIKITIFVSILIIIISKILFTINFYNQLPKEGFKRAGGIFELLAINTCTPLYLVALILLVVKSDTIIAYVTSAFANISVPTSPIFYLSSNVGFGLDFWINFILGIIIIILSVHIGHKNNLVNEHSNLTH
jgi:hypothetical protein